MAEVASSKSVEAANGSASLEKISTEELAELRDELQKKSDKLDFIAVLKLLCVLSKKQITRDLLKDTLIGKNITALTKMACQPSRKDLEGELQAIKRKAAKLIELWKKASDSEKKQTSSGGGKAEESK